MSEIDRNGKYFNVPLTEGDIEYFFESNFIFLLTLL